MSFIYDDKDLINKLLNFGSDFEQKYIKIGQQAAPVNADKANLLALLNGLEKEVGSEQRSLVDQKQQVDSVSNVFSAEGVAAGQVPLSLIDMQTKETFNHWMNRNNIEVNLNGKNYKFSDPEFDGRVVVTALHNRAKLLSTKATSDDAKNIYAAYIQQVEALAPSIEFQGKPTDLGLPKTNTTTNNGNAASTESLIRNLANSLPFNSETINFGDITDFIDKYVELVNANQDQKAQSRVQQINQFAQQAKSAMAAVSAHANNMTNFPINRIGPHQVKNWYANSTSGQHYLPIVTGLANVLTLTNNILSDLARLYGNAIGDGPLRTQQSIYNIQFNQLRYLEQNQE